MWSDFLFEDNQLISAIDYLCFHPWLKKDEEEILESLICLCLDFLVLEKRLLVGPTISTSHCFMLVCFVQELWALLHLSHSNAA